MMPDPPVQGAVFRSILMADIVRSTELYERLGNVEAKRLVGARLSQLSRIIEAYEGRVVKSLGDGLLCSFHSHEKAIMAALQICDSKSNQLEIRVGICCGDVVEEAGDVFGDAVNTAARIMALAKPSEALISRSAEEPLPLYMHNIVRRAPAVSVKGKQEPIELYAILNQDDPSVSGGQTVSLTGVRKHGISHLELSHGQQRMEIQLGEELTIGRDPDSKLVILGKYVSRRHARIYQRQHKFVLEDRSANGTFLVPRDQPVLHLLREEAILHDSGCIYLGADPKTVPSDPLRYRVR